MNDVKDTLKALEWTTNTTCIDKNSMLPVLVKPTKETASKYEITEDPVLLRQFWIVQRLVAQSLEDEGAYVVGPQVDIPADFTGTFKFIPEQKGNQSVVQTFFSMKEVAMEMPQKVFCQERVVAYPVVSGNTPSVDDKVKSVVFKYQEQLSIVDKQDIYTAVPSSRFPFVGKSKVKYTVTPSVTVLVESTQEMMNLPLSTRGPFSTLLNVPTKDQEYDFERILKELDLPINLTTTRNCPKTLIDESFLQPGTRFRISAIEEHEIILGVTIQGKIVEFSSYGEEFLVPSHLDQSFSSKEQEIAYQTAFQRFLLELQIKDSPVNLKDYQKSIRKHISRNVRCTYPKPLHMIAALRESQFSTRPPANEITAIALFSSANESPLTRHSSAPSSVSRSRIPLPAVPSDHQQQYTPPLPPRNRSSFRGSGVFSPPSDLPSRQPPLPPNYPPEDLPLRPPPLPPLDSHPYSRPKSFTVGEADIETGSSLHPSHNHTRLTGSWSEPINGHFTPDESLTSGNVYGTDMTIIPSPPHLPAPTLFENQDTEAFSYLPTASNTQLAEENSDAMWGEVSVTPTRERRSSRRNRRSPYENVPLRNQDSSPSSERRDEFEAHRDVETNDISSSQSMTAPRSLSPEFEMSASYDNPAYVQSPTESDDATTEQPLISSEAPVYSNVSTSDSSDRTQPVSHTSADSISPVVQSSIDITNDDQRADESPSFAQSQYDATVSSNSVVSEDKRTSSFAQSSKESSDSEHETQDICCSLHVEAPSPEVRTKEQCQNFFQPMDDYENVICTVDTSGDQNLDSEESQHQHNSVDSKVENFNPSDSNNNQIIDEFLVEHSNQVTSPKRFYSDDTPDLSTTTMSGEHSFSSHSLASTKSSVVESEVDMPQKSPFPNMKEQGEDRDFWISRYSVNDTDNMVHQHVSFTCNYAHPPEGWVPPEDLSSLSVAEVCNSLRFIGMNEDTVEWFYAEKVDGQLLCTLEGPDLSQHFHLSPFQCKKLIMFLNGWRPKLK